MGNGEVIDALIHDGLSDAYGNKHMGIFADQCASKYGFTRQQQDDFAVRSHTRARKAVADRSSPTRSCRSRSPSGARPRR